MFALFPLPTRPAVLVLCRGFSLAHLPPPPAHLILQPSTPPPNPKNYFQNVNVLILCKVTPSKKHLCAKIIHIPTLKIHYPHIPRGSASAIAPLSLDKSR